MNERNRPDRGVEELIENMVSVIQIMIREIFILADRNDGVLSNRELRHRCMCGKAAIYLRPTHVESLMGLMVSLGLLNPNSHEIVEDPEDECLMNPEVLRIFRETKQVIDNKVAKWAVTGEVPRQAANGMLNRLFLMHDKPGFDYRNATTAELAGLVVEGDHPPHIKKIFEEIFEDCGIEPKTEGHSLENLLKEFGGGEVAEA
jgi:hypothetical protein